jgi:hypothetical protein
LDRERGTYVERQSRFSMAFVVLALMAPSASGCVVNEAESPTRGVVVSGPPPAPVREDRSPQPTAPSAQSVWVSGYWHWTGMQYAWIPGHWDAPPPGATWNAPIYTARDGKYFYETGGWKPAATRNAVR